MIFLILLVSILAVIIAGVLIAAIFVEKQYLIKQELIIDVPHTKVYSYLKNLKNQTNYNKWVMTDPNVRLNYTGEDGEVGFVMAWDSDNKNVGRGEQEIKKLIENSIVASEVRFIKPFTGIAQAQFDIVSINEGQTRLSWSLGGERKYPLNLTMKVFDGMLSKDIYTSLNNIKNIIEK